MHVARSNLPIFSIIFFFTRCEKKAATPACRPHFFCGMCVDCASLYKFEQIHLFVKRVQTDAQTTATTTTKSWQQIDNNSSNVLWAACAACHLKPVHATRVVVVVVCVAVLVVDTIERHIYYCQRLFSLFFAWLQPWKKA